MSARAREGGDLLAGILGQPQRLRRPPLGAARVECQQGAPAAVSDNPLDGQRGGVTTAPRGSVSAAQRRPISLSGRLWWGGPTSSSRRHDTPIGTKSMPASGQWDRAGRSVRGGGAQCSGESAAPVAQHHRPVKTSRRAGACRGLRQQSPQPTGPSLRAARGPALGGRVVDPEPRLDALRGHPRSRPARSARAGGWPLPSGGPKPPDPFDWAASTLLLLRRAVEVLATLLGASGPRECRGAPSACGRLWRDASSAAGGAARLFRIRL